MPELPEVETVRRTLVKWCQGKTVKNVYLHYPNVLENVCFEDFKCAIKNQKINSIERIGKYLIFILDKHVILSHLRMEGKYFFTQIEDEYVKKHKIITFVFDDGNLIYHDVRKFGRMKVLLKEDYMLDKSVAKLGKEPFTITAKELYNKLQHSNKKIKQCLLDQSVIAGLGNIYVDEVLFDSGILPFRNSKDVSESDCAKVIASSIKILNRAIELKGSTIATYHFNNNETGGFQNEHKVYGKKGCNCSVCSTVIAKTTIGGRGTYYCSNCQK